MRRFLVFIFIATTMLCGCSAEAYIRTGYYLGTGISLSCADVGADEALDAAMEEIARIDAEMNYSGSGAIRMINERAGEPVPVSGEVLELINLSLYIHNLSDGAFNPALLPLMEAWGMDHISGDFHLPEDAAIQSALANCDAQAISADNLMCTIMIKEGMGLDLGGIAKGYAGDEAARTVLSYGAKNALLALGGNIVALGAPPGRSFYRVGISHPRKSGEVIATIETGGRAIVTSGDYERYFIQDGIRYHHIMDPRTGYPARSGLVSVTILSDSSAQADALSTAVFVLGVEEGLSLLAFFEDTDAVLICEDQSVYATAGIITKLTIHDEEYMLR